jgi:hypothetical protein
MVCITVRRAPPIPGVTGGIIEAIVDMEVSMSLIQVNVKVWKRCIDNNDHFNYFIFGIVDYTTTDTAD